MPENYQLFVNEDSTLMVTVWPNVVGDVTQHYSYDPPKEVTVATRQHMAETWGPPIHLTEEK